MLQDESDEMLSRGFKDQIYDVYRYLPPDLQVTNVTIPIFLQILVFLDSRELLVFYSVKAVKLYARLTYYIMRF